MTNLFYRAIKDFEMMRRMKMKLNPQNSVSNHVGACLLIIQTVSWGHCVLTWGLSGDLPEAPVVSCPALGRGEKGTGAFDPDACLRRSQERMCTHTHTCKCMLALCANTLLQRLLPFCRKEPSLLRAAFTEPRGRLDPSAAVLATCVRVAVHACIC